MKRCLLSFLLLHAVSFAADAQLPSITIDTPMSPPEWALLQRSVLDANNAACRVFFDRYFDERGWLLCVERWGGDDGPDDAIENLKDWPVLHALGGSDDILHLYKKAWEGHLRQFTLAKTTEVPFARDGMYYKEFPVMFDWLHNGEGLCVFNLQGLSDPHDRRFQDRVRRYAGFYMNEDADAPNYDPKHKIIRSMFNGSRGPLLRKATALDWAGDFIEVGNRFKPGHHERSYQEMLDHFRDYNDIVGDHPQNLLATSLAANAYMLAHEQKYKNWLLEYVDAWRERMLQNNGIIPTNIGLDGKIGSAAGGKWYGGVYGWGFSVIAPHNGEIVHRNNHNIGFHGFANAYLLTGDDRYLDPWRKQIDIVNSHKKLVDGRPMYPHMHGDEGWYAYKPEMYRHNAFEIYVLSMKEEDKQRVAKDPWIAYLDGKNPSYPEQALRHDLARVRQQATEIRDDNSTPDTRLSDDSMRRNPASVDALVKLALGGIPTDRRGILLHCRLRYFDADRRRAGLPEGVAALIDSMTHDAVTVTLVNTNQLEERSLIVQGGAYAEHEISEVTHGGKSTTVNDARFAVRLQPGAGERLTVRMRRHSHQPTLALPGAGR